MLFSFILRPFIFCESQWLLKLQPSLRGARHEQKEKKEGRGLSSPGGISLFTDFFFLSTPYHLLGTVGGHVAKRNHSSQRKEKEEDGFGETPDAPYPMVLFLPSSFIAFAGVPPGHWPMSVPTTWLALPNSRRFFFSSWFLSLTLLLEIPGGSHNAGGRQDWDRPGSCG